MTIPDPRRPGPLGAGPAATVYFGLHDGVPVALKVFPARFDRRTLTAVERERARLAGLGQRSLLVAQAVEQLPDGRHALRSELAVESLAGLVGRLGPLPVQDALTIGCALADALAAAHAAGVVHGGVKPANVLLRTTAEPVLADSGTVLRQAFPQDPERALDGLAPETLRTGHLDERTDLYGLGAVLHLALTAAAPLPTRLGESSADRVLRLLSTPVPAIHRPGVPVDLATVVARLLASDPAHRPPNAAWVAARFAEMLGFAPGAPVPGAAPASPADSDAPAPSPARRPAPAVWKLIATAYDRVPDDLPAPASVNPGAPGVAAPGPSEQDTSPAAGDAGPFDDFAQPQPGAALPFGGFPTPGPVEGAETDAAVPNPGAAVPSFEDFGALPPAGVDPGAEPGEGVPSFDDFAGAPAAATDEPHEPWAPGVPPQPRPVRRSHKREVVLGSAALVAVAVVVVAVVVGGRPDVLAPMPAEAGPVSSTAAVPAKAGARVDLAPPSDLGNEVALSWTSSRQLDFAVVVAAEGEPNHVVLAKRVLTMKVPVDPVRKYCFQIQGTDGVEVYFSRPMPVRGAVCHP